MKFYRLVLAIAALWLSPAYSKDPHTLEDARNFHRVSDVLLTAGQIYPEQVAALQSESVELIINLAVADPSRNAEEPFAVQQAGINYVNIPVLWDAPTPRDLELFFAMMDARQGRKTLVHCFANFRASAFTYLYRVIREGVPEVDARKDLYAVWDEAKFDENPVWRTFINESMASHGFAAGE